MKLDLRKRALLDFVIWLRAVPGAPSFALLLSDLENLHEARETVGRALYHSGRSLGSFKQTILALGGGVRFENNLTMPGSSFISGNHFFLGSIVSLSLRFCCGRWIVNQSLRWGWRRCAACCGSGFPREPPLRRGLGRQTVSTHVAQ